METADIRSRLERFTAEYDPAEHTRCLLDPFRDLILQQRVKYMSYEQIAGALNLCGLRTSREAVRMFCRRQFTEAQILRGRAELKRAQKEPLLAGVPSIAAKTASAAPKPAAPGNPFESTGPRIARDNY